MSSSKDITMSKQIKGSQSLSLWRMFPIVGRTVAKKSLKIKIHLRTIILESALLQKVTVPCKLKSLHTSLA